MPYTKITITLTVEDDDVERALQSLKQDLANLGSSLHTFDEDIYIEPTEKGWDC
jgi:hypothetical protein